MTRSSLSFTTFMTFYIKRSIKRKGKKNLISREAKDISKIPYKYLFI